MQYLHVSPTSRVNVEVYPTQHHYVSPTSRVNVEVFLTQGDGFAINILVYRLKYPIVFLANVQTTRIALRLLRYLNIYIRYHIRRMMMYQISFTN